MLKAYIHSKQPGPGIKALDKLGMIVNSPYIEMMLPCFSS